VNTTIKARVFLWSTVDFNTRLMKFLDTLNNEIIDLGPVIMNVK